MTARLKINISFSSLMDIDKLIRQRKSPGWISGFSSLMDIDKLIQNGST